MENELSYEQRKAIERIAAYHDSNFIPAIATIAPAMRKTNFAHTSYGIRLVLMEAGGKLFAADFMECYLNVDDMIQEAALESEIANIYIEEYEKIMTFDLSRKTTIENGLSETDANPIIPDAPVDPALRAACIAASANTHWTASATEPEHAPTIDSVIEFAQRLYTEATRVKWTAHLDGRVKR